MSKRKFLALTIFFMLLVSAIAPISVSANAALSPNIVVVVIGAPEDTTVSVILPDGTLEESFTPQIAKEHKLWESYFRIWYDHELKPMDGLRLLVSSSVKQFECQLPMNQIGTYEELVTLDFASETMTVGQPPWRQPVLVGLRIMITLLLEGLVFFLMGFRKSSSWLIFLIVNLLTQGWLNITIVGPVFKQGYWGLSLIWKEIGIVMAESVAFTLLIKEKKKLISVYFAILANVLSLLLGAWVLMSLPV